MPKFSAQFFPVSRLPKQAFSSIQALLESAPDAPTPETPNNSLMFLAKMGTEVIGYASVTVEKSAASITSLFILPTHRHQQLGFKLMLDILDKMSKTGCQIIRLKCQEAQLPFFQSLGFIIAKQSRTDEHLTLENPCPGFFLDTLKAHLKTNKLNLAQFKSEPRLLSLTDDKHHYTYTQKDQFLSFHRSMLSQAQKQIWVMSDTILSPVLSDETVRDSLLRLSKRNSKASIKILLEDDKVGAGHYNPTIELAQKLTSFIEIRAIPKGVKKNNELISCVDFTAGIFRKNSENYTGFAHYNNHLIAERLRNKFEQHWQFAKPSLQMRRLSI